jgi:hypothetical protein
MSEDIPEIEEFIRLSEFLINAAIAYAGLTEADERATRDIGRLRTSCGALLAALDRAAMVGQLRPPPLPPSPPQAQPRPSVGFLQAALGRKE